MQTSLIIVSISSTVQVGTNDVDIGFTNYANDDYIDTAVTTTSKNSAILFFIKYFAANSVIVTPPPPTKLSCRISLLDSLILGDRNFLSLRIRSRSDWNLTWRKMRG